MNEECMCVCINHFYSFFKVPPVCYFYVEYCTAPSPKFKSLSSLLYPGDSMLNYNHLFAFLNHNLDLELFNNGLLLHSCCLLHCLNIRDTKSLFVDLIL